MGPELQEEASNAIDHHPAISIAVLSRDTPAATRISTWRPIVPERRRLQCLLLFARTLGYELETVEIMTTHRGTP